MPASVGAGVPTGGRVIGGKVGAGVGLSVGGPVKVHVVVSVKLPAGVSTGLSTETRKVPPLGGGVSDTDDSVLPAALPHAGPLLSFETIMLDPSLLYTTSRVSNEAAAHVSNVTANCVGDGGTTIL